VEKILLVDDSLLQRNRIFEADEMRTAIERQVAVVVK
jgi:hypothetical protein